MSGIEGLSGATGAAAAASGAGQSDKSRLDANYELFLSMLTTQIQNQDPLDPTDSSKYTEQLVQYSSVEQQIKTNDQLAGLLSVMAASSASNYVSYIGTDVVASGATTRLDDGEANWTYETAEGGPARVEIRNSLGAVVYAGNAELNAGRDTFTWDGRTNSGSTAPDGDYTVTIARYDANNDPKIRVRTEVSGTVDGVEFTDTGAVLTIGGARIPANAVISVSRS
ncbi:flagellar hook capping FlgD N-terminal domain-containing protein [Stappia sp.]|uniref:flagellar hook assembly protein FlgD n=1 Tax=Stappia sp. TaxID=1870903 RepID=UPI0032D99EFD